MVRAALAKTTELELDILPSFMSSGRCENAPCAFYTVKPLNKANVAQVPPYINRSLPAERMAHYIYAI